MAEELKDAAIHILSTMWDISQNPSKIIPQWDEGRIAGLYNALYSTLLVAQRSK
jgi:hypothetical protein